MSINENSSTWRLTTPGGIPIKRLSMSGSFGEEDSTVNESYVIEAHRLINYIEEGFPVPIVYGGVVFYPRRAFLGGLASLTVKNISFKGLTDGRPIDPFGQDNFAPTKTYERYLEVQVTYGTRPENDIEPNPNDPVTFLEINTNATGEFLASPVRGKKQVALWKAFGVDPTTGLAEVDEEHNEIDIPQPIVQSLVEWTLTWKQIPPDYYNAILVSKLRTKMGKVNDAPISLFNNAPAETVMFLGFSTQQQFTWRTGNSGKPPVILTMKFLEKNFQATDPNLVVAGGDNAVVDVTHNHMYRGGLGWRRMEIGGTPLYDQTDLNEIFINVTTP